MLYYILCNALIYTYTCTSFLLSNHVILFSLSFCHFIYRIYSERKKTNREAILRKRAKQREAYLARLESEGRYDPNKPSSKPDPERWIPKSQRSYNRRGRGRGGGGGGGRYKSNVGAQGGGVADAGKLDVAARVAAKASGGDGSGGKPSTANIKVSSSGATRKGKGGKRR